MQFFKCLNANLAFLFNFLLTPSYNRLAYGAVRSTTRSTGYKINDLAFVDDTALLENDSINAQRQLDSLKTEAGKVGLEINVQKTEQMWLNKPANISAVDHLLINDQPINIVDDFKWRKNLRTYLLSSNDDDDDGNLAVTLYKFSKVPVEPNESSKLFYIFSTWKSSIFCFFDGEGLIRPFVITWPKYSTSRYSTWHFSHF